MTAAPAEPRRTAARATLRWWWWLAAGQWRAAPGRTAVSVAAVAIGVALALAIHLVNASALEAFRQAIASVNGEAHAQVRATAGTFDEALYARLLDPPIDGVAGLSPVLEARLAIERTVPRDDDDEPVRVPLVALDPFAAAPVTPALLASAAAGNAGADTALFRADAVFLSAAAIEALGVSTGDPVTVRVGLERRTLRVGGTVPGAPPGQVVAVMDLGSAQWLLDAVGRLTRVDLRVADGADAGAVRRAVLARLPADATWTTPDAAEQRMSNLSRAYRVNLSVLALVALFTGAFLVFSTMALAVVRQQGELALAGVLGAPRAHLAGAVLLQGTALGALGAVLGAAGGVALAAALLQAVGGDLGGGYFAGTRPTVSVSWPAVAGFAALGLAVGVLGALAPARAVARIAPARALRAGSADDTLATLSGGAGRLAAVLAVAGAALLAAPAVGDLPLAAYAAIGAWLVAGVTCVPLLVRALGTLLARVAARRAWHSPPAWFALHRLAQSPGAVGAALAGVVASFALSSAMAIMVYSFRVSVADWLVAVLPADLYARVPAGAAAPLDPALQAVIAGAPGVARAEFLRAIDLSLEPGRPEVTLLVRDLDPAAPGARLPITGAVHAVAAPAVAVWVSEAMAQRYDLRPGSALALPLPGRFTVAGVWRDYARQHGAAVIARDDWHRLGGDRGASDVALWLEPGADAGAALAAIEARAPALTGLQWRSAREIRAVSLRIFDRSFAVTYVLEAIAIGVGLFGVAAACAGDALARAREFGMMRHVGVTRRQVGAQLAIEAALGVGVAVLWGGLLGAAIGLVLIERVNPQSFHWTMDVHWPIGLLVASGAALLLAAVAAALLAGRQALGAGPLGAVRQDW